MARYCFDLRRPPAFSETIDRKCVVNQNMIEAGSFIITYNWILMSLNMDLFVCKKTVLRVIRIKKN